MPTISGRGCVEPPAKPFAWIPCLDRLPPEGELVETKIDDGGQPRNFQPLYRQGRLWFIADGSMYVYYTPTHWRRKP